MREREREKESNKNKRERAIANQEGIEGQMDIIFACMCERCECVWVCVCVCMREEERERERWGGWSKLHNITCMRLTDSLSLNPLSGVEITLWHIRTGYKDLAFMVG